MPVSDQAFGQLVARVSQLEERMDDNDTIDTNLQAALDRLCRALLGGYYEIILPMPENPVELIDKVAETISKRRLGAL